MYDISHMLFFLSQNQSLTCQFFSKCWLSGKTPFRPSHAIFKETSPLPVKDRPKKLAVFELGGTAAVTSILCILPGGGGGYGGKGTRAEGERK